jgi:hypothetical protein
MKVYTEQKNRVSHVVTVANKSFMLFMHGCGELLLVENVHGGRACRYDAAMIRFMEDEQMYYIVKYSREKKIPLKGFDEAALIELSMLTGVPFFYDSAINFVAGNDYYSPMIRSVLNWAKKHPRMAKEDGLRYFIEAFKEDDSLTPLPDNQYTGY